MTREEAIRILEGSINLSRELLGDAKGRGDKLCIDGLQREIAAHEMAIAALREQEENRWIPVTERMPEEHESIVPNWGTVSKPLLVAFVCTTSEEPYPKNCVVCETMSHNGMFTHKSYSGEYKAIAWMLKPMPPKEEV